MAAAASSTEDAAPQHPATAAAPHQGPSAQPNNAPQTEVGAYVTLKNETWETITITEYQNKNGASFDTSAIGHAIAPGDESDIMAWMPVDQESDGLKGLGDGQVILKITGEKGGFTFVNMESDRVDQSDNHVGFFELNTRGVHSQSTDDWVGTVGGFTATKDLDIT